jgi:hypothetical protein
MLNIGNCSTFYWLALWRLLECGVCLACKLESCFAGGCAIQSVALIAGVFDSVVIKVEVSVGIWS